MTAWDDQLADHPIHGTVRGLADLLGEIEPEAADVAEQLDRIREVVEFVAGALDQLDAALVPASQVDGVNTALTQVSAHVSQYMADSQVGHLNNAQGSVDTVLQHVGSWILPGTAFPDAESLRVAIHSYRKSAGQHLRGIETQVEKVEGRMTKMSAAIEKQDQERQTQAQALEARLNELTEMINQQRTRVDEVISTHQGQFSDQQQERAEAFERLTKELRDQQAGLIEESRDAAKRHESELKDQAQSVLKQLAQLRDDAAELVGVIGTTGITGGYQQYADEEKRSANRWRVLVVVSFIVLLAVAVWAFATSGGRALDWQRFASKLTLTIPVAFFTAYAARQSSLHRDKEQRARKAELELKALDPYLALFPDDDKHALKSQIAPRFFGQPLEALPEDSQVGVERLVSLMEEVLKTLREGKTPNA